MQTSSYLGVRVPAYNETDWSRATFTEDSIGLAESGMTKTDWVHLQYLISSTAQRSIGVSTPLSKNISLYIPLCTHIQYVSMTNKWFTHTCYNQRAHMKVWWSFGSDYIISTSLASINWKMILKFLPEPAVHLGHRAQCQTMDVDARSRILQGQTANANPQANARLWKNKINIHKQIKVFSLVLTLFSWCDKKKTPAGQLSHQAS